MGTQTTGRGLVRTEPDRVIRARLSQRCMRCREEVGRGDQIGHYSEGWCHAGCTFGTVVLAKVPEATM